MTHCVLRGTRTAPCNSNACITPVVGPLLSVSILLAVTGEQEVAYMVLGWDVLGELSPSKLLKSELHSSLSKRSVRSPVPRMHAGELGSPKELQRFALEAFPSLVTRISAATLHTFVAADALAPAVLLFTDKDETPGAACRPSFS